MRSELYHSFRIYLITSRKILGTFCPQRKSSVPGPFAKASAAQPAPLARLIFYFMDRALRSYRVEHAALYASVHAVCSARYG